MAGTPQENGSEMPLDARLTDLLAGLVRGLVDEPDAIHIEADEEENSTELRLYLAGDDLGKVIGKQGRTARSLRTVLSAVAGKEQHRVSLDVLDEAELEDDDLEDEADEDADGEPA